MTCNNIKKRMNDKDGLTSCKRSWAAMAFNTFFLLVSCTSPPRSNSSNIKYAFSKLKMMSSSHTCETRGQISDVSEWSKRLSLPKNLIKKIKPLSKKNHEIENPVENSDNIECLLLILFKITPLAINFKIYFFS
jgi:hypothetical protein